MNLILSEFITITPSPTGKFGENCGLFLPFKIKVILEASLPTETFSASIRCYFFLNCTFFNTEVFTIEGNISKLDKKSSLLDHKNYNINWNLDYFST